MSFAQRFDKRWEDVIKPGIKRVRANGVSLEPVRIKDGVISDSIHTEIRFAIP